MTWALAALGAVLIAWVWRDTARYTRSARAERARFERHIDSYRAPRP